MRTSIVAVLCVGVLLCAVARADLEKGTYAPDIEAEEWLNTDEPVSLVEQRGMITVLFFWVTWHPGSQYVMPLMNQLNSQIGRRWGVYLVGLTDADRETAESMLEEEKAFFVIGTGSDSYEEYKIDSYPRVVVIDANGKVYWTGWPGSVKELVKAIQDCAQETPPTKTHPVEAAIAERYLKAARTHLREEEYRKAFKATKDADEHALVGDPLKTRCLELRDLIEVIGRDELARALAAVFERDFELALELLHKVRREFLGLAVSTAAKRTLNSLEKKYPEVARMLEAQGDSVQAESELAEAMELIRNRLFGEGYEKLENLIEEYDGTEAAEKAQTIIDRIREHDDVMGYVRDFKSKSTCSSLLAQARAYVRQGRREEAKKIYRQIMDKHPDTIYEDEAAKELMKLP